MKKRQTVSERSGPPRKSARTFRLFLADQTTREIEAKSLLSALAESGISEEKTQILAAVETCCLATPRAESSTPALVAIIRNPNFLGKVDGE